MEPELSQFGKENKKTDVIKLNVDDRETAGYQPYAKYMTSNSIPFTVIVDKKGKVKDSFTGSRTADDLKKAVKKTK